MPAGATQFRALSRRLRRLSPPLAEAPLSSAPPCSSSRRGERRRGPPHTYPGYAAVFPLPAGDAPHPVGIKPADRLLGPVREPRDPAARRVAGEARDIIPPHDRRPMQPDEQ